MFEISESISTTSAGILTPSSNDANSSIHPNSVITSYFEGYAPAGFQHNRNDPLHYEFWRLANHMNWSPQQAHIERARAYNQEFSMVLHQLGTSDLEILQNLCRQLGVPADADISAEDKCREVSSTLLERVHN